MSQQQPTNQEILQAVNQLGKDLSETKTLAKTTHKTVQDLIKTVNTSFTLVAQEFHEVKKDITHLKNVMVTKDYLDDKLYDLRGDFISLTRKEDTKTVAIVHLLEKKRVFTKQEAQSITNLEPFSG